MCFRFLIGVCFCSNRECCGIRTLSNAIHGSDARALARIHDMGLQSGGLQSGCEGFFVRSCSGVCSPGAYSPTVSSGSGPPRTCRGLWSGSLQFGGLQFGAHSFEQQSSLDLGHQSLVGAYCCGAYSSLGACSLEPPIWDLVHHPSVGAYSLGAYSLEPPI